MGKGFTSKKKKSYSFGDNGVMEFSMLWDSWTEQYKKRIVLKDFISELAKTLATNKAFPFKDDLKDNGKPFEHFKRGSEFPKPGEHWNRLDNIYETGYTIAKYDGYKEFELFWTAKGAGKTKYSQFGRVLFKLDLVCRYMVDVEVVEDGKKKIMQEGTWEFRNKFFYYNSVVRDYFWKIPFVKDSVDMQRMLFDHFYKPKIDADTAWVEEKVMPIIWNVIYKHFK